MSTLHRTSIAFICLNNERLVSFPVLKCSVEKEEEKKLPVNFTINKETASNK